LYVFNDEEWIVKKSFVMDFPESSNYAIAYLP